MESTDAQQVERRARRAYEMSRLRRAIVAFAPMLSLVALAAVLGHRPWPTLALGASFFVAGVWLLWYGRDIRRAVLPSIAAGAVPLVLALCARHLPHACMGGSCFSVCIPACAVGGLIAGCLIVVVALRARHRPGFWITASGLTLLTGSMGCMCVGGWGILAQIGGFVVGGGIGLLASRLGPGL
jgi:hypothetical protein